MGTLTVGAIGGDGYVATNFRAVLANDFQTVGVDRPESSRRFEPFIGSMTNRGWDLLKISGIYTHESSAGFQWTSAVGKERERRVVVGRGSAPNGEKEFLLENLQCFTSSNFYIIASALAVDLGQNCGKKCRQRFS